MLEKLPEALGHALVNQRAGMENVLYNELYRARQTSRIDVRSPAFAFNGRLPPRFTADGEGLSPPLAWDAPPSDATSIVIMVEDADAPTPHPLVHAIVVGLPGKEGSLPEGALNSPDHEGVGLDTGRNSFLREAWLPPDPPRGHGEHRYVFQVFALREGTIDAPAFSKNPGRRELIHGVLERAVACGCIIGTYEREGSQTEPVEQPMDFLPQAAT